jgi:hypothetical protein
MRGEATERSREKFLNTILELELNLNPILLIKIPLQTLLKVK